MAAGIENERKFENWRELPQGGRRYWRDVHGRRGWRVRYVKVVDASETTVSFVQEVYDPAGLLVEVHEKFPDDQGHRKLEGGQR